MEGGDQRGRLPKGPEPRRKRYGASNDELARLSSRGEVSPVIIDGQHQHPFGLQDFDYEMGSPTKDAQPPLSLRSCLLHEPL